MQGYQLPVGFELPSRVGLPCTLLDRSTHCALALSLPLSGGLVCKVNSATTHHSLRGSESDPARWVDLPGSVCAQGALLTHHGSQLATGRGYSYTGVNFPTGVHLGQCLCPHIADKSELVTLTFV